MPILHRDNCYILVGRILLFVWDAHFYVGMSKLIVKTGKISLFAWDAYFHSGMPIFTVKLGTRMPIYIYVNIGIGVPILREIWHPGCLFLGVPIFTWHRYSHGISIHLGLGTPLIVPLCALSHRYPAREPKHAHDMAKPGSDFFKFFYFGAQWGCDLFWAQISRELVRLYEYSYLGPVILSMRDIH